MPPRVLVRRVLSQTPLARRYEQTLAGERRTRRRIPWKKFERSRYPGAALDLAGDAQLRLAEGEYHAIGLFGRIASGVAMAGVPFDIVAAATRVSSDELRHADYCIRFATLCTGDDVVLSVSPAALEAAAAPMPREEETDFLVAKYAATGETLAAALLHACRKRAKDPVARALFSSILADEVHHAHFGWYYLHWRAPFWTRAEQQALADRLGEFVADVERSLWFGRDAPAEARAAADALGVLDTESQRAVVRQVMEEEIVPGLDAVGLGASHAWRARRRGGGREAPPARDFVFGGPLTKPSDSEGAPPRTTEPPTSSKSLRPEDRAAAWLAAQVSEDGAVCFATSARGRSAEAVGPMHHGRATVVVRALELHGRHAQAVSRARERLDADIRASLSGHPVPGWPDEPALIAGTLALALLAKFDVRPALTELAASPEVLAAPWYAGQVAAALGSETPESTWAACVRALDEQQWAPWTAMAARARGDTETSERTAAALWASVDETGAVAGPTGPEVARTAVTVEALAPFATQEARAAGERACAFLRKVQLAELGEPPHMGSIDGAFPLMPESDVLRTDVTAHALLALLVWKQCTR